MSFRPFEKAASIEVTNVAGDIFNVSAIIHQDSQFLHPNRISLIGTRDQEIDFLGFDRNSIVEWRFHTRTDWNLSDDSDYAWIQRGTGIVRSIGMTQGSMIAEESIQRFAEIEIVEATDEIHSKELKSLNAEYWFLQRPKENWYVHRRSWSKPQPKKLAGPWAKVSALGLRFRLLRIAIYRDDERTNQELERIELPGIEIQPIGTIEDAAFFEVADDLWFSFRVLLAFRYRQYVSTLAEFKDGNCNSKVTWHSIRLEARSRRRSDENYDPPFRGRLEGYLAKGCARLAQMKPQRELLHAAAIGYSDSHKATFMESGHTSCIEGIECLVEAFEQVNGLKREHIDGKRWRTLGKEVRKLARTIDATTIERKAIERALSDVPKLHLLDRIARMARTLPPKWGKVPIELMDGADAMITARNHIVHGRIISDYDKIAMEHLRAQTLFERLWLGFFGCGELQSSFWKLSVIDEHVRQQKAQTVIANLPSTVLDPVPNSPLKH